MRSALIAITVLTLVAGGTAAEPVTKSEESPARMAMEIVGQDVFESYSSPNPYRGTSGGGAPQLVWSDVIHHPEASYICPHFGRMDLGEGDYVVVRSPDGSRKWQYSAAGVDGLGLSDDGFWGIHIAGDTAVVELWSAGPDGGFGYVIDRFARGFTREEVQGTAAPEGLVGADDSEWAPCYEASDPVVYDKSRAVARMLVNGS